MSYLLLRYAGLGGLAPLDVGKICHGEGIEIVRVTDSEVTIKASLSSLVQLTARLNTEWTWTPLQKQLEADQPLSILAQLEEPLKR